MRVLLDECMPPALSDLLRQHGYDVDHVATLGRSGISNGEVYDLAKRDYALLVTTDRHFRHSLPYPPTDSLGIVYIRVVPADPASVVGVFQGFLRDCRLEGLRGKRVILRRSGHEFAV